MRFFKPISNATKAEQFAAATDFVFQDLMNVKSEHEDPEIGVVEKSYQILPRTLGKLVDSILSLETDLGINRRGTFARVHVAIHRKTKVQLAVKIMDRIRYASPEHSGGTDIEKEVDILQIVDHVRAFAKLPGGDLFDYILKSGPLPELEAKFVAYQTLQALQRLHRMNISHRDLKPENLLLTSQTKYPRILLTDFGMAREFGSESLMNTMCGTFAYMAPEVFDVKHAQGPGYGHTADCWSLGITLYVILSGTHPFTANYATEDEKTMRYKMRHSALVFPHRYWKDISPEARLLIKNLLITQPCERWNVDNALSSEWIQQDVAWLRQRYRESVLAHWIKSSLHLAAVRQHAVSTAHTIRIRKRMRVERGRDDNHRVYAVSSDPREITEESLTTSSSVSSVQAISSLTSSTMRVPNISY
ncbi:Serine/threonine-protein kinase D1 [Mortierella claussenii]|nr:Serine/threonine-protein kinase D1 [Mortierella claussenii]